MPVDSDKVSKVIMLWRGRCLFLSRVDGKGWELPGGHLNVGEKFRDGACREVFEETGIKITKLKPIIVQPKFKLFCCTPKTVRVKLSSEHTDYTWVDSSDIHKLKITDATKQNIRAILKTIQRVK